MRLVGTTKPTIIAIRERSHWNSPNLVAQDPVTLGLCSQIDLDTAVKRAAARLERERKKAGGDAAKAGTLLPTEETIGSGEPAPEVEAPAEAEAPMAVSLAREARDAMAAPEEVEDAPDAEFVFAKLKDLKHDVAEDAEETSHEDTPSE